MAKPKLLTVYEAGLVEYGSEDLPCNWGFPVLVVPLQTFSHLGVAVVQPVNRDGSSAGCRLTVEIALMERYYRVRRKKDVLTAEQLKAMGAGLDWKEESGE